MLAKKRLNEEEIFFQKCVSEKDTEIQFPGNQYKKSTTPNNTIVQEQARTFYEKYVKTLRVNTDI